MDARKASRALGLLCFAGALALLASFFWAGADGSVVDALLGMLEEPWELVTLADLGIGLLVVAGWILALERGRARAWPWVIGLFLLGNFVTLVYLGVRGLRAERPAELFVPRAGS